jgi:hypothetical protein
MSKSKVEFLFKGFILLGVEKMARMTDKPENERYLLYLPLELNDL